MDKVIIYPTFYILLGTKYYKDKSVYKGEWLNSQRNGFGEYKSATGDSYKGFLFKFLSL